MFNGIIYNTGILKYIKKEKSNFLIGIKTNCNFSKKEVGSSISCNGACLTLIKIKKKTIFFYVSKETLNRSNFKYLKLDDPINIEKSLIFGQKISGHFAQGHVDTTATVEKIIVSGKTWLIRFLIKDKKLSKFLFEKASIAINGVSLTISKVQNNSFEINVIPHSLKLTNLRYLKTNKNVNIEIDIFAKYILKISK